MSLAQYESVCKEQFQSIHKKLDKNQEFNQKMFNRMFVDNGLPCVQTRLDRGERMWKITLWIVSIVCAASIAQLVRGAYDHMREDHVSENSLSVVDPESQTVRNSR